MICVQPQVFFRYSHPLCFCGTLLAGLLLLVYSNKIPHPHISRSRRRLFDCYQKKHIISLLLVRLLCVCIMVYVWLCLVDSIVRTRCNPSRLPCHIIRVDMPIRHWAFINIAGTIENMTIKSNEWQTFYIHLPCCSFFLFIVHCYYYMVFSFFRRSIYYSKYLFLLWSIDVLSILSSNCSW